MNKQAFKSVIKEKSAIVCYFKKWKFFYQHDNILGMMRGGMMGGRGGGPPPGMRGPPPGMMRGQGIKIEH
jgi:hypothetical protein